MATRTPLWAETKTMTRTSGYKNSPSFSVDEHYVSLHVYALPSDVYHTLRVNGVLSPDCLQDGHGFAHARLARLVSGDSIELAVYRVFDCFENATLVGVCTGVVSDDGIVWEAPRTVHVHTSHTNVHFHTMPHGFAR